MSSPFLGLYLAERETLESETTAFPQQEAGKVGRERPVSCAPVRWRACLFQPGNESWRSRRQAGPRAAFDL